MLLFCYFLSILGRIIRVTDEVVEYRQWIRKTFPCEIVENNQVDPKSRSYASVANSSKAGGSKADIIDNSKKLVTMQFCIIENSVIESLNVGIRRRNC